jgi:hypothetical protein
MPSVAKPNPPKVDPIYDDAPKVDPIYDDADVRTMTSGFRACMRVADNFESVDKGTTFWKTASENQRDLVRACHDLYHRQWRWFLREGYHHTNTSASTWACRGRNYRGYWATAAFTASFVAGHKSPGDDWDRMYAEALELDKDLLALDKTHNPERFKE